MARTLAALQTSSRMALLAIALHAASLAAQRSRLDSLRADSVRRLPTIEITGTIRPAAAPSVGSTTPAYLTEIQPADVHAGAPKALTSVLEQHAGFSSYDDLGSPYKMSLTSRGFFASPVVGTPQGIAVFLDGVRMNESDAAQVNFDLLPTDHIGRIEILSGNGTLLGRNALGGAVNFVTARGDGAPSADVALSRGTYDERGIEAHGGGSTSNGGDYYLGGTLSDEGGWRQFTASRQRHLIANVGRRAGSSALRLELLYADSRAETAGSLPESVYGVRPDSNLSSGDYERLWQAQAALSGERAFGTGRLSFVTYVRRHSADRFNVNQQSDPDAFGRAGNTTGGGTADFRFSRLVGSALLSVRTGVDGSTSRANIQLYADSTKLGGQRTLTTDVSSPVWDAAGFLLADLTVGRTTFSAGARYDHVAIPFRDRLAHSADTAGVYDRLDPRLGLSIELGHGFATYASLGTAFRAPAVIENACADPARPCPLPFALSDDPPLRPVRTTTAELGVTLQHEGWEGGLVGYVTDVNDDIFLTPNANRPEGSTIDGYFVNLMKTRRAGLESNLRFTSALGHSVYATYTYTSATFRSTAVIASPLGADDDASASAPNEVRPGDRLPLIPAHQLKGGADLRLSSAGGIGFDARYVGSEWPRGDEANRTRPLPSYVVADLRAHAVARQWELEVGIANLFDRHYASFGTYNVNEGAVGGAALERFLTPGARRTVRVVLRRHIGPAGDDMRQP